MCVTGECVLCDGRVCAVCVTGECVLCVCSPRSKEESNKKRGGELKGRREGGKERGVREE